jgi:hypothetical protein
MNLSSDTLLALSVVLVLGGSIVVIMFPARTPARPAAPLPTHPVQVREVRTKDSARIPDRAASWDQRATPGGRGRRVSAMSTMTARPGDRLVVRNQHVGGPVRDAEILHVKRDDGAPPYVVRWSDTGHEALVFPGPDAYIEHVEHAAGH